MGGGGVRQLQPNSVTASLIHDQSEMDLCW